MGLFSFNINHKTQIIIITALIWAINFRSTFKNVDSHMDSGSYSSLKFDNEIILIKNLISCFFFIGFFIADKKNKAPVKKNIEIIEKTEGNKIIIQEEERKEKTESLIDSIVRIHRLDDKISKFMFWLKIIFIITTIYLIEEFCFIIANNHILDRLVCSIRNAGIFLSLLIFSPLITKKSWSLYRHQLVPIIIIFLCSAYLIFFNIFGVKRFGEIYGVRILIYFFIFVLTGIEIVLIKFLVDTECLNIYLILGIKGVIGTIIFGIIYLCSSKEDFFDFLDDLLNFELEDMLIDFGVFQKILYIVTLLIIQYLKIFVISLCTENHFLSVLAITDLISFPFYCIERFFIQDFGISNGTSFSINIFSGITSLIMMLIFNEILECNFFGLNINLEKHINERQRKDYLLNLEQDNIIAMKDCSDDGRSEDTPFDD